MSQALQREAALSELSILDTKPEPEFDIIARLAQQTLKCPIALISLIDRERQWFKSDIGLGVSETPVELSFCAHAARDDNMLVVPDATRDLRFQANPLVTGNPNIRFYAGAPIHAPIPGASHDVAIGALCVIDDKSRIFDEEGAKVLNDLALLVDALMRARSATARAAALAEERRIAIEELDRKQRQFRQAERMANIGSWRLTLADNSTQWSDQVFAIHSLPHGQQPDLAKALDFFPPHARETVQASILRTMKTGQPFDVEADFTAANGVRKKVRIMGEVEIFEGVPVALIGVIQDITERHRMEQELRRSALIDELTQLGNRAGCNRAIEGRMRSARERSAPAALMLIDLDGFKGVNDRCGHAAGDALLRTIGMRLKQPYLSECFVGRLGGDEFVVLASSRADCADFEAILHRLLHDLRISVPHAGGNEDVTGTVGVAWLDASVNSGGEWLHRADEALYRAKRAHPGSAIVSHPDGDIVMHADRTPAAA